MSAATIRRTCSGLFAGAMLLLVTACGSDSGTTATDDPTTPAASPSDAASSEAAPEGPACADIWVEGGTLEKSYTGCVDDTGLVAPDKVGCSSGQTFILYGDGFWAVKGGVVKYAVDGRTDAPAYLDDMAACRG